MQPPAVVLTEYAPEDRSALELWWKNAAVAGYLGDLGRLLRESEVGSRMTDGYIARPTLRWMARPSPTGEPFGFIAVQVTGDRDASYAVVPPLSGGVNIAIDPLRCGGGLGPATMKALLAQPELADLATLGGAVDVTNLPCLKMLLKLGISRGALRGSGRKVFFDFVIPRTSERDE
ncbi:hypothetical protein [Nocardia sp. NPDC019395]|uniref:hypothetical protein n=1 Tax=Nocardia sp. NPDC019395 TaxID=3154686 RepID=UPI0033C0A811